MLDYPQVAEYRKAVEAAAQARSAMIDAEKLLTAAIDNQQVNWIASDSDVYAFFTALLSEHADIDDGLFDAAAELFGLKPDDQDEQANLDS
jgi:hypothetical protein